MPIATHWRHEGSGRGRSPPDRLHSSVSDLSSAAPGGGEEGKPCSLSSRTAHPGKQSSPSQGLAPPLKDSDSEKANACPGLVEAP